MFLTHILGKYRGFIKLDSLRLCWNTSLKYSTKPSSKDSLDVDKPITYTQSPASKWKAEYSRKGTSEKRLQYETPIVLISLTVFMVYFCILREESDVDEEFNTSLYKRVKGLEEQQLLIAIKNRKAQGLDTTLHEEKLKEIRNT